MRKSTTIIRRGFGYYEIKFVVNGTWIGSGYSTNRRFANRISKLFITGPRADGQYSQIGREIVKL